MAPRLSLSFQQKGEILKEVAKGELSKTEIAKKYAIPKSTLLTIIKAKDKVFNVARSSTGLGLNRKRTRGGKWPELEEALVQWMKKMRGKNIPIDGKILKEQAETFALRMNVDAFKGSCGWLQKFTDRHGLTFKKVCGESAWVNTAMTNEWKEGRLKTLLEQYPPQDVFNADETGLMFKLLPDRTLMFKDEKCHGGKRAKVRITIMLAANMTGTEKLPLLIIGKAQNPRCFKGIRKLPAEYKANKKAWMTAAFYEEWLYKLDRQFSNKGRKVLLFVDNCTAPVVVSELLAIKVEFLPPNATSVLQPMDQGVIQAFKKHYRRMLLKRIILCMENDKQYDVDLLAAIHLSCAAWKAVSPETISNCFRHAGFPEPQSQDDHLAAENEEDDECLINVLREKNVAVPKVTTFDDFANVDSNIVCVDELSDEDIVKHALEKTRLAKDDGGSSSEEDGTDVVESAPKVSSKEAAAALDVLRRYFQDGNMDSVNLIADVENQHFLFSKQNLKQRKMIGFFIFTRK